MKFNKIFVLILMIAVIGCLQTGVVGVEAESADDLFEMEEVVVTASRYPEELQNTSVSMEIIDREEIENSGAGNVADLLSQIGGLLIKDKGGAAGQKTFSLRGLKSDQVLILIDGQPLNNPQDGSVYLEEIPVNFIKRIEVSKSPASAVYGPNAMGGVVNIITKEARDIEKTSLSLGYGSESHENFDFMHSFNMENSALTLILNLKQAEGERENSAIDRDTIFTKYEYSLSKNSDLTLTYKYNDSEIDYPGSKYYPTSSLSGPGSRFDIDRNLNLSWNQNLQNLSRQLTLYENNHDFKDVSSSTTNAEREKQGLTFKQTHYLPGQTLNWGLEIYENVVEYESIYLGMPTVYDEENTNKGIFLQDKIDVNDNNTVTIGARYDDHEEYGSEISPRLGYIYNINENLNLSVNAGKSFKAPSFMDLYYPGSANPDLDPEKTDAYEMGLKYQDQKCRRELNIFRRDVEDKITANLSTGWTPYNIDSATIEGAELLLSRRLNQNWTADFNYTYLDAVNDDTEEQLGDIPSDQANLSLNRKFDKGNLKITGTYMGERRDGGTDADLSSHFVADLRLSRDLTKTTRLSLSVNNIFDKDYQIVDGYPMPERNYMVEMSFSF